jgi:predicted GIY-YIG superfamily endonuclease/ribosomal protein S14
LVQNNKPDKETYVLRLGKNKYYVGESNDIKRRIWVHENGNGSAWTKQYGVEELLEKIDMNDNFDELSQTVELMKEYGVDNVRGSMFTKPFPLDPYEKVIAAQLYCELHNLCRKCGGNDHFIGACCSQEMVDWVKNFGGNLEMNKAFQLKNNRECLECRKDISSLPSNFKYCRQCFKKINGYK